MSMICNETYCNSEVYHTCREQINIAHVGLKLVFHPACDRLATETNGNSTDSVFIFYLV